jgi:hypothetical protein
MVLKILGDTYRDSPAESVSRKQQKVAFAGRRRRNGSYGSLDPGGGERWPDDAGVDWRHAGLEPARRAGV